MKNKKILYPLAGSATLGLIVLVVFYINLFGVNIRSDKNFEVLYISTGANYQQVLDSLNSHYKISNLKILNWVAMKKNYPAHIKPGRYMLGKDLTYPGLINILRSGNQLPVRITFSNVRTINQIAGKIGGQIEADSIQIIKFLANDSNYKADGFTLENIISVFLPNTYELYWNTDAGSLYNKMLNEYRKFWNKERLEKARAKHLEPVEVSTLASIIECEVSKQDEKQRIAGVYINRLRRGIPLQADPTVKFALNDFAITRILKTDLLVDSPYNTYKHSGLPPGPIGCASIDGIDAVLNAEIHDYLYMAAKPDFSGYHNFSRTLSEHLHYAALYQKELNRRKIFK
jgi:UPF0755 protein